MKKKNTPKHERLSEDDLLFDASKTTAAQRKAMQESLDKLETFGLDPLPDSVKAILKHSKRTGKVKL